MRLQKNSTIWTILVIAMSFSSCQEKTKFEISKIKSVSKLATVEFVVSKTVYGHKDRRFPLIPIRLNRASFMAFTEARIKAGINLAKIKQEDISIKGSSISLKLPPIEILNFSYPAEGFIEDTLFTDQSKFLNKITIEDQEHLFRQADLRIREQIPKLGIEVAAEESARILLEGLLEAMGFQEIYLEFSTTNSLDLKDLVDFE